MGGPRADWSVNATLQVLAARAQPREEDLSRDYRNLVTVPTAHALTYFRALCDALRADLFTDDDGDLGNRPHASETLWHRAKVELRRPHSQCLVSCYGANRPR
jgi:hypothetical protein